MGKGVNDDAPPVTKITLKGESAPDGPFEVLRAKDYSESEDMPPSGVGITYYWINDSGPRIYTGPVPVKNGDAFTYWSIDRAGNVEWRRTKCIRSGSTPNQALIPKASVGSS